MSLRSQASAEDVVQLQELIASVAAPATSSAVQVIDDRWRSDGLYNLLKLRMAAGIPSTSGIALLIGQTDIPIDGLADLQLVSSRSSAATPALVFKTITSWLIDAWSTIGKEDKVCHRTTNTEAYVG